MLEAVQLVLVPVVCFVVPELIPQSYMAGAERLAG